MQSIWSKDVVVIRPRNEHTIAAECTISGRGYWSGKPVRLRFAPAGTNTGIRFVRSDLPGQPYCPANTTFADGTSYRTNIARGEARFEMIEHVMAALYALEIDNCLVISTAEEMPGLDGSAWAYVEALQSVGLVMQANARKRFIVDRTMHVGDPAAWIEVSPTQRDCGSFEYNLDYGPSSPIKAQTHRQMLTPSQFAKELAKARTFVTADQAEQLRSSGVGAHVTNQDLIVFSDEGEVIDNQLRFDNECARHKTLDLIGDLALAGVDLVGNVVSYRGGHRLNAQLARELSKFAGCSQMNSARPSLSTGAAQSRVA